GLAGPLPDRLDLVARVDRPDPAALRRDRPERSAAVAARVAQAQDHQRARGQGGPNARLPLDALEAAGVDADAADLLERVSLQQGTLSGRADVRVLRGARNPADPVGAAPVIPGPVARALPFHRHPAA